MRTLLVGITLLYANYLCAQRCTSAEYQVQQAAANQAFAARAAAIESFISQQIPVQAKETGGEASVIKIPVVIHVVYHTQAENISLAQINSQLEVLNNDFRRKNPDSSNTPVRFKALAADTRIEFSLATVDPLGRKTDGIIRKYSNVSVWSTDDKIKYEAQGGSAAWDAAGYLNIWVGNFRNMLGYSSALGCDKAIDGVAINTKAFGTIGVNAPYHLGRTAVHEIGHWLGLKHIWGDTYCGDD